MQVRIVALAASGASYGLLAIAVPVETTRRAGAGARRLCLRYEMSASSAQPPVTHLEGFSLVLRPAVKM